MAVTLSLFNKTLEYMGDGTIDIDNDTLKVALLNDYTFDGDHINFSSEVSLDEISAGSGYDAGGASLVNVGWAYDAGDGYTKLTADDVNFTATADSIGPVDGAVVYSETADKVLYYIDFGQSYTMDLADELLLDLDALNGMIRLGAAA